MLTFPRVHATHYIAAKGFLNQITSLNDPVCEKDQPLITLAMQTLELRYQ